MKYFFKNIETCAFCGLHEFKILGKRLNKSQGKYPNNKIGITTTIVKCSCCGLVFPNPLPIPDEIQNHYGIPPESYWKPEYFVIPEDHLLSIIQWMQSIQNIDTNAKILDIGAGIGKNMIVFGKKGYDAYGIEPSLPFYERAIGQMGINPDKLKQASVDDCFFDDNVFDVIYFTAVLEHLFEPSITISKIMNWLKPGGLVFIEVPSADWLINKIANFYYKLIGTDYVANLSPMHSPFHIYEFTRKSFEIHARSNNYDIVDSQYFVCDTYCPKIFNTFLKKYMRLTNTGMEMAIWLRKKK